MDGSGELGKDGGHEEHAHAQAEAEVVCAKSWDTLEQAARSAVLRVGSWAQRTRWISL